MSIMLPDSSESIERPTKVWISACSPRWAMPSSITPATSWPKRTQRVQWMQRLISSIESSHTAVTAGPVLQLALAALGADRAVQRVVDQQELHHALLGLDGLVALGAHD